MRSPTDLGPRTLGSPRRRIIIIVALIVIVIALFSLRSLAVLWTEQMWFSSIHQSSVFSTLLEVKIGLAVSFGIFFFLLLFGNLLLTDRLGARDLSFEADDELVRRFQNLVRPYARRAYAVLSLFAGLIAGLTAKGQWQSYILFANAQSFHQKDPLFHKDLGFYVFRLPFLTFIVDWLLAALIVVIVFTVVFHYLNGGIRTARTGVRVSAHVKVHLSVLLAAVAIMKAVGYVIAKWQLVVSTNGYVEGAGYADVHARIPALTILFFLSLFSAAILLFNIRSRGWSLPLLAVGLWLFVAIVIGYIYPSALQALKVNPAQSKLELPYIQRNIDATRSAYNLNGVQQHNFAAKSTISAADLAKSTATLANIRIWDPDPSISLATVRSRQDIQSYYTFASLAVDRYYLNGELSPTPVLIGVRQINESSLPAPSWVNEHLVYTHGYGAVIMPANEVNSSSNPNFALGNVPPTTSEGLPTLTQPDIYFGINLPGWVVANTNTEELNYKYTSGKNEGNPEESHYQQDGGVAMGGFFSRAAFALRFGDLNLLISDQITPKSRIIFERNVLGMAQSAAPFISWGTQPYPVIYDGTINYVLDGFTTTSEYPYSENASTLNSPSGGLPSSYNYVRNSVKLVINAYTGAMTFYAADPTDPILEAYRAAFPNMFVAMSSMPAAIASHLRYPSNLFSAQAATLGRYHITTAADFYGASDQWIVSPTVGAGRPAETIARTETTNAAGVVVSSSLSPMDPLYQVMALPGSTKQQLLLSTEFVPTGSSATVQSLSAFLIASSDPDDYGQLNLYVTPPGQTINGPLLADSAIEQNKAVSETETPLDQHGSEVLLGNNLMIPLTNTVLYVRPLYVTSSSNPLPQLKFIITVFDNKVGIATTLNGALAQVGLASTSTTKPPPSSGHASVSTLLADAATEYADAQNALRAGDLSTYQKDISAMDGYVAQAQAVLSGQS